VNHIVKSLLACGIFAIPALAQYEDLVDLADAPTRSEEETSVLCTVEGVQFNKKDMGKGVSSMSVVYLLTESPSAYFNYYDAEKKAVVFDFYDTRIGDSPIEPIRESPFTNSSVELFKLDLNKDVEGLKPDIRDVVRVTLFSLYDFEYDVQEDVGVITMSFKWSKKHQARLDRSKKAFYWQFPLALALAGGAGYVAYDKFLKKDPAPNPDPWDAIGYPSHSGL